jgi:hypothetical protein
MHKAQGSEHHSFFLCALRPPRDIERNVDVGQVAKLAYSEDKFGNLSYF